MKPNAPIQNKQREATVSFLNIEDDNVFFKSA